MGEGDASSGTLIPDTSFNKLTECFLVNMKPIRSSLGYLVSSIGSSSPAAVPQVHNSESPSCWLELVLHTGQLCQWEGKEGYACI